jgi:hypothetical protein
MQSIIDTGTEHMDYKFGYLKELFKEKIGSKTDEDVSEDDFLLYFLNTIVDNNFSFNTIFF